MCQGDGHQGCPTSSACGLYCHGRSAGPGGLRAWHGRRERDTCTLPGLWGAWSELGLGPLQRGSCPWSGGDQSVPRHAAREMSRKCQGARAGWLCSPGLEGPIDLLSEIDAADFPAYARSSCRMKYRGSKMALEGLSKQLELLPRMTSPAPVPPRPAGEAPLAQCPAWMCQWGSPGDPSRNTGGASPRQNAGRGITACCCSASSPS